MFYLDYVVYFLAQRDMPSCKGHHIVLNFRWRAAAAAACMHGCCLESRQAGYQSEAQHARKQHSHVHHSQRYAVSKQYVSHHKRALCVTESAGVLDRDFDLLVVQSFML